MTPALLSAALLLLLLPGAPAQGRLIQNVLSYGEELFPFVLTCSLFVFRFQSDSHQYPCDKLCDKHSQYDLLHLRGLQRDLTGSDEETAGFGSRLHVRSARLNVKQHHPICP